MEVKMNETKTLEMLLERLISEIHDSKMATIITQKEWLNTEEAAFLLGITPQTLNQRATDKTIAYYKGKGKYRSYNKKELVESFFGEQNRIATNREVEEKAAMERQKRMYGK
jgi:hypothetical protein